MKKALLLFVFLFLLLVLGLEAYKHQMRTYNSYSLSEVNPPEIANTSLNNLLGNNHFVKCSFHVDVGSAGNGYYVYFVIINGSFNINVTLEGVAGEYKCVPNGVILYSYYLSDYWGKTHVFYCSYNKKTWNLTFPSITKPIYYLNSSVIFLKQGSEELNVKPCLYWVDLETGALSRKICLQEKHGATVGAVKFFKGRIYLATSTGHIYLIEGSEVKRAYFDSIWGITVGARIKLDVSEKYAAVAYSFANVEGKEKNGLCVFTSGLRKIACRGLKEEPQAVRIHGNTVYVRAGGKLKAYRILKL